MPHQIRTVYLPPRPLAGRSRQPSSRKGGARRPNDQGSSARHRTSRLAAPSDRQHPTVFAQDSRAPLSEVVVLPAARGCDDQPAVIHDPRRRADTNPTRDPCRRPGRRLSEEITVPASDQQSHSTRPTTHEAVPRPQPISLRSGTTLIRLLIRPTGGPGRCRRPRRTSRTTRHAEAARSVTESHRVTGTEPGGPPPRSTATTLTDLVLDVGGVHRRPGDRDRPVVGAAFGSHVRRRGEGVSGRGVWHVARARRTARSSRPAPRCPATAESAAGPAAAGAPGAAGYRRDAQRVDEGRAARDRWSGFLAVARATATSTAAGRSGRCRLGRGGSAARWA